MKKDWVGDSKSVFRVIGASNHSLTKREENDYYATDPKCVEDIVKLVDFNNHIWEPACGEGHLSKKLEELGYDVISSDLIDRGYGKTGIDFFKIKKSINRDIITNPPYKYATKWVYHSLSLLEEGNKLALLLKITFLEGKERYKLYKNTPPKYVYVYSSRQRCCKNGDFNLENSPAICYAWYIWEKGYKGDTIIKWIEE